jgi:hypothetical protein
LFSESTFPLSSVFVHHALLLDLAFKQYVQVGADCAVSSWLKKRLRWGTLILFKCEMEDSHVKSLAGNRQRKRFRSQHR